MLVICYFYSYSAQPHDVENDVDDEVDGDVDSDGQSEEELEDEVKDEEVCANNIILFFYIYIFVCTLVLIHKQTVIKV